MSAQGSRAKISGERTDLLAELSMQTHHIQLADPRIAASTLIDPADRLTRSVKRAASWKNDPEVARRINDGLASGAN